MKAAVIVNPGLEKLAQQELREILNVKTTIESSVLLFEIKKEDIDKLTKLQSIKRVILPFGEVNNEKVTLNEKFPFNDHFSKEIKLKIEVENVKGQDNRIEVSKNVTKELFPLLESKSINAEINYKNPEHLIIVYNTEKKMIIGLDYTGKELNTRDYRLFSHSASFKGDLAYYFVRKSGFKQGEKLLSGFCKDGSIAIETALFSPKSEIFAFDTSVSNITAAKKNVKLAKVNIESHKYSLEDLDIKYPKESFDRIIFHVTKKDENQLNEIYYQAKFLLKSKGTLLLIGRENWEITIPEKFKLLFKEPFKKGESIHQLWLLERK